MILIACLFICLYIGAMGILVWSPRWIKSNILPRVWCDACHRDITGRQQFLAKFQADQSLESRRD